ncbi:MAG TPA: hypothetical protein VEN81_07125 [Planctomycetota bacterium]|nr:hypothetical protein [Planctomycetota bacterium]
MKPIRVALLGVLLAGSHALSQDAPKPAALETWSPFGIGSCHSSNWGAPANERWMPQMIQIGLTNHRTPNTGWSEVEPEEGKWRWDTLDKQMAYLDSLKISYGGIFNGNVKWNTKDKRGDLPVNNLEAWGRYCGEVVKHCKGHIKNWEVWNEPSNGTGRDQTAADYAKIVVAAYDAAKASDPDCKIGIAAKSVALTYLDQAIAAGAKGHFDYLTLHPYEVAGCMIKHPGTEMVYLQIEPTVRKMLQARDPARAKCPIVFTEIGHAAGGQYGAHLKGLSDPDVMAHAVVKYYALGIAQGIACVQWFEGMDGDSGPMGLLDGKAQPRPAYAALGKMIELFGLHPTYLGWVLLADRHYAFAYQGAKGTVLAAWASTFAGDKVDFGKPVRIVDPTTGQAATSATYPLTVAPIFVEGIPEDLLQKAKANKAKPFPWGGDYSGAKSVSVSFGEKNVEKGLHTQSAETIASDVLAYGGGARVGSVPGGNVYMVDPNFLAYTTVPIEIQAVVRRNEKNDPAKLTLTYESTSGYKKAEPFEIPDNEKWHTARWKIDDAQFVSQWAYNFTLNSGKYALQSVTVTRLDR